MSYTLDEFSNDHLVDEGGNLRRPTDAENAMILDGIVKFLSHFGIRDTTVLGNLVADDHSEPSVSIRDDPGDTPVLHEVTEHVVNPANNALQILAQDEAGHGRRGAPSWLSGQFAFEHIRDLDDLRDDLIRSA